MGTRLGVCPMAFWVMLQSIMGYGYPPLGVDKLTKWNYYLPVILRTQAVTSALRTVYNVLGFTMSLDKTDTRV